MFFYRTEKHSRVVCWAECKDKADPSPAENERSLLLYCREKKFPNSQMFVPEEGQTLETCFQKSDKKIPGGVSEVQALGPTLEALPFFSIFSIYMKIIHASC